MIPKPIFFVLMLKYGGTRKPKLPFFFDNSKAQNKFALFYLDSGIKAEK